MAECMLSGRLGPKGDTGPRGPTGASGADLWTKVEGKTIVIPAYSVYFYVYNRYNGTTMSFSNLSWTEYDKTFGGGSDTSNPSYRAYYIRFGSNW